MTLILPRRRFLQGLIGLVAAPAVIRAERLMKVVSPKIVRASANVLDMGGTLNPNASIWCVQWGEATVFGVYPESSEAGFVMTGLQVVDYPPYAQASPQADSGTASERQA
jgi:hypothetical protein